MVKPRLTHGILVLDKPPLLSSHQATAQVKRLFSVKKAGHGGTLDPLATGVLPIFLGEATKVSQYLLDADKHYTVTAKMGSRTDTADSQGNVLSETGKICSRLEVLAELKHFLGKQWQRPPMYSAVKYQGKPLYVLARAGITVERKPREVEVFSVELQSFEPPFFTLEIKASKGIYVRTFIDDLGERLGCFAYVTALRRLQSGGYRSMVTLPYLHEVFNQQGLEGLEQLLLSPRSAVAALPEVMVDEHDIKRLFNGGSLVYQGELSDGMVQMCSKNQLLGIGCIEQGLLFPRRLLNMDHCA